MNKEIKELRKDCEKIVPPELRMLVVDTKDYTLLKKELAEQYNIELDIMEKLVEKIDAKKYHYVYVRADSKAEVDDLLTKVEMADTNLIMITENYKDEKFIWNAAKYFADILRHLTTAEAMISRINCMFNTNITKVITECKESCEGDENE